MRKPKFHAAKAVVLLLLLSLMLVSVIGGTLALIVTQTPALINTFLSGLDPVGDLVISKEVIHPFGDSYQIFDGVGFSFTVSLGETFAGKTVATSQGEQTADGTGCICVDLKPGEAVRILDIPEGTEVTVTEQQAPGFTPDGGSTRVLTVSRGDNPLAYTNTYAPGPVDPVNLQVTGVKHLEGRPWQEGDAFTLQLEYKLAAGDAQWQSAGTVTVAYDPGDPSFDQFDFTSMVQALTYDTAGEYAFRVSEIAGTIGGVTYDKVVSYFDVLVGDRDMDGALEIQGVEGFQNAQASYDAETNTHKVSLTVSNTYAPAGSAEATIRIRKTVRSLSGEDKSPAGFAFELYDEQGTLAATSGQTSAAGETEITLSYDAKDAGTTFRYTLKEALAGQTVNGITYADTQYAICVQVIDDLDGTVSARVYQTEAPEDATDTCQVSFENVYDPEDTKTAFGGGKKLTGRDLKEGEFAFDLYCTGDGFTVTEDMTPIQTVSNGAEGQFQFDEIPYSTVGTYRYVVMENTSKELGGVTYDDARFHVSVTVTDENGALKAETAVTDELGNAAEILFQNTYAAEKTSAIFTGTKILDGAALESNMFTFVLYRADQNFNIGGEVLDRTTNNADGSFAFEEITYTAVGEHYYVVTEDASAQVEGMEYDKTAYGIAVKVTDNGKGSLETQITVCVVGGGNADEIVFTNIYTEPEKPTVPTEPTKPTDPVKPTDPTQPSGPSGPTTGDDTRVGLYVALMLVSLAAMIVLLFLLLRKRKKERE